jgi:hypothetical protein
LQVRRISARASFEKAVRGRVTRLGGVQVTGRVEVLTKLLKSIADAAAIVLYPDGLEDSGRDPDMDAGSSGVERIVDQFHDKVYDVVDRTVAKTS